MLAVKASLAFAISAGVLACGKITEPVAPVGRVALTTRVAGAPALLVQNTDGTGSVRLRFDRVVDSIPGNGADLIARDDNLLALASPRWDASGSRVAVVATVAYDQSELVVMDATGAHAQVASVSSQIIGSAPDWNSDGAKLAYTMSTAQGMGGLDLFVTDLATHQVRRLTTGANLGRAVVRWSLDGRTIYVWHRLGETGGAASNALGDVIAVDASTGSVAVIRSGIVGEVQDISGGKALVLRNESMVNGSWLRDLVAVPLTGNVEQLLISGEPVLWASWATWDFHVALARSASAGSSTTVYEWLQTNTGDRRVLNGIAGEASLDLYVSMPMPD